MARQPKPFDRELEREKLRVLTERSKEQGNLVEEAFPVRGAGDDGQGIDPRRPVESVDLTGKTLIGFSPIGSLQT